MLDPDCDLLTRIRSLERQVRSTRVIALALLGLVAVTFLLAQATPPQTPPPAPQVPAAERLVLTDRSGRERAVLGDLGGRVFGLAILDAEGKKRIVLTVDDTMKSPFVTLRDERGIRRVSLYLLRDGTPTLAMRDAKGKTLATMGCVPRVLGEALPDFFPALPKDFSTVLSNRADTGYFSLNDQDGKTLFHAP